MKQVSKRKIRREDTRKKSKKLLELIVSGDIEIYVAYRRLYALWCANNSAIQELRPMFRISGISPDGTISVTEEFRFQIISIAREILPAFGSSLSCID